MYLGRSFIIKWQNEAKCVCHSIVAAALQPMARVLYKEVFGGLLAVTTRAEVCL